MLATWRMTLGSRRAGPVTTPGAGVSVPATAGASTSARLRAITATLQASRAIASAAAPPRPRPAPTSNADFPASPRSTLLLVRRRDRLGLGFLHLRKHHLVRPGDARHRLVGHLV